MRAKPSAVVFALAVALACGGWLLRRRASGPERAGIGVLLMYGERPMILAVEPGSPAEKAGLKPGDVLLEADGLPLPAGPEAETALAGAAGSDARLTVSRAPAREPLRFEVPRSPRRRLSDAERLGLIRASAEQGLAAAQYQLAARLLRGQDGAKRDYAEAALWFGKAADNGVARAASELGQLYETGLGVPKDEKLAAKFYFAAAKDGDAQGRTDLGVLFLEGRGGLSKDAAKAIALIEPAAKAGHPRAQAIMGSLYSSGTGVPKDPDQAIRWLQRAAEAGDATAAQSLAEYKKALGR